jgi:flavin reductase (DIM6/NTAB) family NADH-FMN oxidoreductase RutF
VEPADSDAGVSEVVLDPADIDGVQRYFLLNSIVVPRPISWISTVSPAGVPNLAPHSYTTVLSPDPPIVGFVSVKEKDTLRNVRATGDFVYNLAGNNLLASINLSAADFPAEESEFRWTGLTAASSDLVQSPRVAEAPISMECRLDGIQQIRDTQNFLVMGEVVRIHISGQVLTDQRVDPRKLNPVGRLSGSLYSLQGDIVSLKRPTYAGLREAGAEPSS